MKLIRAAFAFALLTPCLVAQTASTTTNVGQTASAVEHSKCATAEIATTIFEMRREFATGVQGAKAIFVTAYHNPQSGLVDPPPPDSLEKVESTVRRWPLIDNEERRVLRAIKKELTVWGKYLVAKQASDADLILVIRLGRRATDPVPDHDTSFGAPISLLRDDSLYLYARGVEPGLIWCGNQPGGLHVTDGIFPLLQRLESDARLDSKFE